MCTRFRMFRGLSVNPISVRVIHDVYKIGCLLVRGISLPAAQLFVIVIENILRGGVGNLTRRIKPYKPSIVPVIPKKRGEECM